MSRVEARRVIKESRISHKVEKSQKKSHFINNFLFGCFE